MPSNIPQMDSWMLDLLKWGVSKTPGAYGAAKAGTSIPSIHSPYTSSDASIRSGILRVLGGISDFAGQGGPSSNINTRMHPKTTPAIRGATPPPNLNPNAGLVMPGLMAQMKQGTGADIAEKPKAAAAAPTPPMGGNAKVAQAAPAQAPNLDQTQVGTGAEKEEIQPNAPAAAPAANNVVQMEQKKQGNADALIAALGDIGASLMGPFQESWQAQLGRTAGNMARSNIYSRAMEQALAGQIPDETGLAMLTPEQQMQIANVVAGQQREQARAGEAATKLGLEAREVATGERAQESRSSYETSSIALSRDELNQRIKEFDASKDLRDATKNINNAHARALLMEADRKYGTGSLGREALAYASDKIRTFVAGLKDSDTVLTQDILEQIFANAVSEYKGEMPVEGKPKEEPKAGTKAGAGNIDYTTYIPGRKK